MFFTGVSAVFPLPKKEDVEPTEEQESRFVRCVLSNKPFTETVKIGEFHIVLTTPSADEYSLLNQTDEEEFADALFAVSIQSIRRGDEIVYLKDTAQDTSQRMEKIRKIFNASVVLPVLVGEWYRFRTVYNKLYSKAMTPGFFVQRKDMSGGSS